MVAIDIYGVAHLCGCATSSALGLQAISAVWEAGRLGGWKDGPLLKTRPEDLGCPPGVKFTSAATVRAHTTLVASNGACFSAGLNSSEQVSRERQFVQAGWMERTDLLPCLVWSTCLP